MGHKFLNFLALCKILQEDFIQLASGLVLIGPICAKQNQNPKTSEETSPEQDKTLLFQRSLKAFLCVEPEVLSHLVESATRGNREASSLSVRSPGDTGSFGILGW